MLALATVAVYARVAGHQFVDYDDNLYITENQMVQRGLTLDGVRWAFTTLHASNWHPLTWLSHMMDCALFARPDAPLAGQWAGGHHVVNLLLHVANVVVLFSALNGMTRQRWRAALVAALFALHPLHVESVAWVAERKDVLSALLGFLAIWSYAAYARNQTAGRYVLVVILFAFSLLAKPMLVTLPFVLLLLDYWPLDRLRPDREGPAMARVRHLIIEKVPLMALAAASSIVTLEAQARGGSMFPLEALPLGQRIGNAVVAYAAYLGKMLWPAELAVLYPHPGQWPWWQIALSATVIAAISALAFVWRKRHPHLLVGWLWYLGTLVPVIGLVQVGQQSMADRYTYVPLIGVFIMAAWTLPGLRRPQPRRILAAAVACVLAAMSWLTWTQLRHWRDSFALLERAVAVTDGNFVAHNNLGYAHRRAGRLDLAIHHYRLALAINPRYAAAHVNLGNALSLHGRPHEADAAYREGLRLAPSVAEAHRNYGKSLLAQEKFSEVEERFRQALALEPDHAESRHILGIALARQNKFDQAIVEYRRAIELDPTLPELHANLGLALATQDRLDEAIASFKEALRLRPGYPEAQRYLQTALEQQRGGR